jgi:hypothetical protein
MIKWLIFLVAGFYQSGEWYYITNVKGSIRRDQSIKQLGIGDSVRLTDKLLYSTPADRLVVLHPTKGRFIIKDQQKTVRNSLTSRILLTVSENFIPASKINLTASRSPVITSGEDVSRFIHSRAVRDSFRIILADSFFIPVQIKALSDSSAYFFYLQYQEGELIENKKLLSIRSKGENNLWRIYFTGQALPDHLKENRQNSWEAQLFYYDGKSNESFNIGRLFLQQPFSENFQEEVLGIKTVLSKKYSGSINADFLIQQDIQNYYLDSYE